MDRRKFRCKNCKEWFRPNEREHYVNKTTRNYGGQELKAKEVYCCRIK